MAFRQIFISSSTTSQSSTSTSNPCPFSMGCGRSSPREGDRRAEKETEESFFSFFPYSILSLSAAVSENGMRDEVFCGLRPERMHKIIGRKKNKCRKNLPLFSHCATSSSNKRTIFRNKKRLDTLSYYIPSIGKLQILIWK